MAKRRAAAVPGAAELLADYKQWLAADGRGSACYLNAAWAFLGHCPQPADFAAQPLEQQLSLGASQRPFLTFLMLTGRCRPSFDYLASVTIGGLLAQAGRSPLAGDVATFTAAATDLDYSAHNVKRAAERVAVRLLVGTGRPLRALTVTDLDELAGAFHRHGDAVGNTTSWANDRMLIGEAHRVLFHLGVLDSPPADPRRVHGLSGHYSGVPEPLQTLMLQYCTLMSATHAPATMKAIASHLAAFGRFLGTFDPPLSDLTRLERQRHIEAWLTALSEARHDNGTAMSVGHTRGQILTVRQFLAQIAEWGWPSAPQRTLIFSRDIPRAPQPLPRYLPPDADRRLLSVLQQLSQTAESPLARLHADALLLTRATGVRIGELRDLELDCVHEIDGQGAWLKVPLGKLRTERMVPLDEETVTVIDRIVARRTPGRPLPHPRTGQPVAFLLVHQGHRPSAQAIREELARACQSADLPTVTTHALRHTFATALVNAGVSLQALMQLLGHVSAAMSLRYGQLFDSTVRAEYERALTQTKALLDAVPAAPTGPVGVGTPLPLVQIAGGADWRDTATIKSRLAAGFCLRAPAQGSCPYANICEHCPNFRTDSGYLAILGAQRADTLALATDAESRGWGPEATRHRQLADRLDQLMTSTHTTKP